MGGRHRVLRKGPEKWDKWSVLSHRVSVSCDRPGPDLIQENSSNWKGPKSLLSWALTIFVKEELYGITYMYYSGQ